MISRRGFFLGSAAIILTPGLLMPVKKIITPKKQWIIPILAVGAPDYKAIAAQLDWAEKSILVSNRNGLFPGTIVSIDTGKNQRMIMITGEISSNVFSIRDIAL